MHPATPLPGTCFPDCLRCVPSDVARSAVLCSSASQLFSLAGTFLRLSTPGHSIPSASNIPGGLPSISARDSKRALLSIFSSTGSAPVTETLGRQILARTALGDVTTRSESANTSAHAAGRSVVWLGNFGAFHAYSAGKGFPLILSTQQSLQHCSERVLRLKAFLPNCY